MSAQDQTFTFRPLTKPQFLGPEAVKALWSEECHERTFAHKSLRASGAP